MSFDSGGYVPGGLLGPLQTCLHLMNGYPKVVILLRGIVGNMGQVTKIEAARRQIDAAIDLYFSGGDFLAIYTIGFAAHQILNDIYDHHRDDGFLQAMSQKLPSDFRRHLANPANFLKHADRDRDACLPEISYIQIEAVLCVSTVLYKRISGDLSLKMKGFDYILEEQAYEAIGVEEVDTNIDRVNEHAARRERLKKLPDSEMLAEKAAMYQQFIEFFPTAETLVSNMKAEGKSIVDFLDAIDKMDGSIKPR